MSLRVPVTLVPMLRASFTAQGLPASILDDAGNFDPTGVLAIMYDRVEFRSSLTPPIAFDLAAPAGPPSPIGRILKPHVRFSGRAGVLDIAPFGEPNRAVGWIVLAAALGVIGVAGYALGRAA